MNTDFKENERTIKELFNVIINDMYIIAQDSLPSYFKKSESIIIEKVIKDKIDIEAIKEKVYFKIRVLDELWHFLKKEKKLNKNEYVCFVEKFLKSSIAKMEKNCHDELENKNYISLIIYSYICLECFNYY